MAPATRKHENRCFLVRSPQNQDRLRRNRYLLLGDQALWMFAAGLLDAPTVLASFVTRYSSSLVLVALLIAIRTGCNLLPQLFAAHLLRSCTRKKPWLLAADLLRSLPIAAIALLLFIAPRAPASVVLTVLYVSLVVFAVANCFGGLAWWDILGKSVTGVERPALFGGMMLCGSVMGFASGVLIKALFDSPRWSFPHNYALLFTLAFAALAMCFGLVAGLVEPEGNAESDVKTRPGSLDQLRRMVGDGGPFARLLRVQVLLGAPVLAAGLYTPYALRELKLPLDVTGIFVAAAATGTGVGGLCLPVAARRWGSKAVLAIVAVSVILVPLTVAVAGWIPSIMWLRVVCCATGFACQGWAMSGLFVGMNDLVLAMATPGERPLYMALSNSVAGALGLLPLLGSILAQWVGSATVLWLCPLPAVAGMIALRGLSTNLIRRK
jgi:hypothetical protein